MNQKQVFSLSLLLAFAPTVGAQTNTPARGTAIAPRIRPPAAPASANPSIPGGTNTTAVAPVAAAPVAAAPVPPPPVVEEPIYQYNWTMPVEEILDTIYAPLIGRTPLRAPGLPLTTTLTLKTQSKLTKAEAIQALETIMGMNGITIVPIGEKFFKVVAEGVAPQMGGIFSTNKADTLPDSGKFVTEIVQLKYADPQQVITALGLFAKSQNSIIFIPSTQSLILRDYSENVKRMLEMLEKIDVTSPLIIKPKVIPIKYALASDIASALSQLGAGIGGSFGRSSSGAGGGAFGTAAPRGAAGLGGTPGVGGIPGQGTQNGLSAGAGGARGGFASNLRGVINNATTAGGAQGGFSLFGQTKIIADERTNSLLVFANDDDMNMITNIISKLDVVLAQVLIEAVILEVNLSDGKSYGVSYLQPQQTTGNLTGAGGINNLSSAASSFLSGTGGTTNSGATSILPSLPGGFSYFGKWGNDLDVVMEAVANDSRISVLSRPRIQTSHAVEADLFIGNTVPYVTGTYNYGYGSGPSSQYTEKEVGITLKVTPLINADGLVVMDIDQEVEQLGPDVQIAGVGGVPTTTKRDAGTKVAVYSGDTIILGGFISASRSKAYSGVPWLMDVPYLGHLFRSDTIANTRTELIILMRPTVLGTPTIAAKVAMDEKHKMAAVEQAEVDIRKDEDARNARAAKELAAEAAKEAKKGRTNSPPVNLQLQGTNANTNAASQSEMERP
jgi:general secretion pathway protein D